MATLKLMKKISQIVLSFFTFVASFYFSFWIIGGLLTIPFKEPKEWILIIPYVFAFLIAAYLAFIVWGKNNPKKNSNPTQGDYIISGAIGLGVIGFLAGFVGPLIFMPDANQGPLLGILITGPGGVVLGAVGGSIYGYIKKKKAEK